MSAPAAAMLLIDLENMIGSTQGCAGREQGPVQDARDTGKHPAHAAGHTAARAARSG